MKAYLALVSREIHERKALLAAAAVASLLPLLAPLLPSTGSNPAADIREAVLWVIVGSLVPLFALLLGVSFIGRDLSEDRLGFYYAQPISGPTIWFGKLTAIIVLVWATEIIIMLPTALLAPSAWHFLAPEDVFGPFDPRWYVGLILWVGPVLIVLLAHALGVVWRGRSVWLLVDLFGLIVISGVTWWALSPFLPITAPDAALATGLWIVAWTLLGLAVSGAVQVTFGRVDLRRGHRVLSTTLWTVLVAAGVAALGWGFWVRAATPRDLARVQDIAVGPGDWIAVTGASRGRLDYYPRFLFNVGDGRWVAIGPGLRWYGPNLEFSADGSLAVWPVPVSIDEWTIMVADLETDNPQPMRNGVVTGGGGWEDISVSPDGSRIVVTDGETVAVHNSATGDQIAATIISEEARPAAASFDGDDVVKILAVRRRKPSGPPTWRRYRFDVESKTLSMGEEIDSPWRWGRNVEEVVSGWYLDRIEVQGEDRLAVVEAENHEVVADLGPMPYWSKIHETDDGRVAVIRDRDGESLIEIFRVNGDPLARIELDDADQILFGGQIESGRLLVGQWNWGGEEDQVVSRLRTILVDLERAEVRMTLDGFAPVLGPWGSTSSAGAWAIGSTASRILRGEDGSLQLWDSKTGELEQLIPVSD